MEALVRSSQAVYACRQRERRKRVWVAWGGAALKSASILLLLPGP